MFNILSFQSEWLLNGLDDLRYFTKMWLGGSEDFNQMKEDTVNFNLIQVCETYV